MFQYSRAAKELWKYCTLTDIVFTAELIHERAPDDWGNAARRSGNEARSPTSAQGARRPPRSP